MPGGSLSSLSRPELLFLIHFTWLVGQEWHFTSLSLCVCVCSVVHFTMLYKYSVCMRLAARIFVGCLPPPDKSLDWAFSADTGWATGKWARTLELSCTSLHSGILGTLIHNETNQSHDFNWFYIFYKTNTQWLLCQNHFCHFLACWTI